MLCPKISRFLGERFQLTGTSLPTGSDNRHIISDRQLHTILDVTDSAWLFIDIKSVGPRDDQDHAVMSHNQISGDGKWDSESYGVIHGIMTAEGQRASHLFHCAIPPLFVVHIVIKPALGLAGEKQGLPLKRISLVSMP